jgi:dephospho-CoA kinase
MPSARNKGRGPLRIGLTGGFGSGKSTVLAMFRRRGARVMDADAIVHDLFARDRRVRAAVARRFGRDILRKDGIDRRALARRVFDSPAERRALEAIVHPAVRRRIAEGARGMRGGVMVADVPLLYESGLRKKFDVVIVVQASASRRVRRLAARGFSARDFQRRARAQWPLTKKARLADHVVDNNGTKERTKNQVDEIWDSITNHARVVRGRHGRTKRT